MNILCIIKESYFFYIPLYLYKHNGFTLRLYTFGEERLYKQISDIKGERIVVLNRVLTFIFVKL